MPEDLVEISVVGRDGSLGIAHLLREAELVTSTSEAFRMIKQGAVRIDGERVEDRGLELAAGSHPCLPGRQAPLRPGNEVS